MSFLCNSCFTLVDPGRTPDCVLTSCFHILCNACTKRMCNSQCTTCKKQCQIVAIDKDMPPAVRAYFEPPLMKIEKIQQQLRFLQQQQEITLKLKKAVEDAEKKKAYRIKKILEMEQKAKAEEQRLEKSIKGKMELYRNMKEKYQKLDVEEARLIKYFKENGLAVDQNISADSGVHSFEKPTRYKH